MTSPWDLYDQLIDEIPADITVTAIHTDGKWRRVASSDTAVLNRIPLRAPTPLPTMIATGVAKPNAHGQLMTSTEMPRARL